MPGKKNWVEKSGPGGHLPPMIHDMYKHICKKNPEWDKGRCIAVAVSHAKRMCATGDTNFPGIQQVGAKARARACADIAIWEGMKAKAKAT
jgi:hypothetical protein